MEEFLINYYNLLNDGVIAIAAIIGIFSYRKYKSTTTKYFIYFLIGAALVDFLGKYPLYFSRIEQLKPLLDLITDTVFINNYWWYNIFWTIGSTLFFSFYFRKLLKSKVLKRILYGASILILVVGLGYVIFDTYHFMTAFILPLIVINFTTIILASSFYLIEVLNSERILNFYRSINFYIAIVILIWWLVTTPIAFYEFYMSISDWKYIIIKVKILLCSNMFMYLTFSIALLWCKPQNN